ncbi:Asp-tRNA(Asn)/Glu-tRNA(Gln) amidotransferase subunit GatA [Nafulsella turpanensis]|uniref:Asp-tRNA(Asn)/Glu-tRNA(Gln) amidotransferase subunit GatA n=1 Tax=Nafulsella turpanensis TaxID=1265690 RepID=UPI000348176E|nr:Asp-tRNA(Asn)/Glu-tRNA(Gln) amidotransferase subunit GatA [Nafulsella turpanensis]
MKAYTSLSEVKDAIQKGETSCQQLVEFYLQNIEKKKHLNAFLEVYTDEAREQAQQVDQKLKNGTAGKLAGMVVGLKDVLCHQDHGLQSSSHILEGFISQFSGTAVQKLLEEDAIVIGRQNCDEFAMGSSNENSAFGPVLNDADNTRVPGGSSGGSAVAVQADMCLVSLGSDTGGSVRQPAAFCGIVGLKPTYGRISRHGLVAYASSFDSIGVFSKSVEDSALVLEVIAGADEYDSTSARVEVPAYSQALQKQDKPYRIAYISNTLESEGLNSEIKASVEEKLQWLKSEGHTVEAVEFPLLDYLLPSYYILSTAEASSNLSRFDGVKYGYRSPNATNLESMYKKTRSEGFGAEVKRRIMLGTFVLSASYYDAYYTKAQKVRRLIKDATDKLLSSYDFIVLPTTPTTAFRLGEHTADPLEMYLADLFTVQANLCGLPAISLPNGTDKEGLPIGLQVVASAFAEDKMFAFSKYLMEA